jgi:hypothetical protein
VAVPEHSRQKRAKSSRSCAGRIAFSRNAYEDLIDAREHLRCYFAFYNDERPHQALGGLAPSRGYYARREQQHAFARVA